MQPDTFTGELLRSTPLPHAAQRVVLERMPDLAEALSGNPHLHPDVWTGLYKKGVSADQASALAATLTTPEQVDHMVVVAQERRAGPLGLVRFGWTLGHAAQRALTARRLPLALATSFVSAPWALPEVRARAAQWVGGDERIELLSNLLQDDLPDDVVWDEHLATLPRWKDAPTPASLTALVRLLRHRPALRSRAAKSGNPFLVAGAGQLPLDREEQEVVVTSLGVAADGGALGPLWERTLLALLDRLDVEPGVRQRAAAAMVRSGSEQVALEAQVPRERTPFPQGTALVDLSPEEVDRVLYRTPVTTFEARALSWVELAANPNLLPDQAETVAHRLLDEAVQEVVGLLPPERDLLCERLPEGGSPHRELTALRAVEEEEVKERRDAVTASARTRPNPNGFHYSPYRPEAPSNLQVRSAGGTSMETCRQSAWHPNTQAAFRHLAGALGSDAEVWEAALRLAENFTGTVGELAEAAKLTTRR